jgi:hypothetical protein
LRLIWLEVALKIKELTQVFLLVELSQMMPSLVSHKCPDETSFPQAALSNKKRIECNNRNILN